MITIQEIKNNEKIMQFIRFCIIGTIAAAVHYGIYYLMLFWAEENISYITGYLISFVGNFYLTSYFTFRTIPTIKKFLGFACSHGINFGLHIVLFNAFLWLGIHRLVAPPLVMIVAMLVQFTILRFIFTPKSKNSSHT